MSNSEPCRAGFDQDDDDDSLRGYHRCELPRHHDGPHFVSLPVVTRRDDWRYREGYVTVIVRWEDQK